MDTPLAGQPPVWSGWYSYIVDSEYYFTKTFSGVKYVGVVDMMGSSSYHSSGGHVISMFVTPTMATNPGSANALLWGQDSVTHDVKAILTWLTESNPLDDSGNPIMDSSGNTVTSSLVDPAWYLTAINAGFRINYGASPSDNTWTTKNFWVAVQGEADGN